MVTVSDKLKMMGVHINIVSCKTSLPQLGYSVGYHTCLEQRLRIDRSIKLPLNPFCIKRHCWLKKMSHSFSSIEIQLAWARMFSSSAFAASAAALRDAVICLCIEFIVVCCLLQRSSYFIKWPTWPRQNSKSGCRQGSSSQVNRMAFTCVMRTCWLYRLTDCTCNCVLVNCYYKKMLHWHVVFVWMWSRHSADEDTQFTVVN